MFQSRQIQYFQIIDTAYYLDTHILLATPETMSKKIGVKWKAENMPSQEGKVAIITGANTGIGYHMAIGLVKKKASVILACRNLVKAEEAKQKILSSVPDADITIQELDLANLSSVEEFSHKISSSYQQIDILINNAGVMIPPKSTTKDGFELQIGTNHLGHFALTYHLLPLLSRASSGRVVTLSSIAHWFGEIDFDDINGLEKKYDKWGLYSQSKLANLLFALELHRRLKAAGSSVESFASHPGYSNTDLQRYSLTWRILNVFFAMRPVKGAAPTLYAATESDASSYRYWGPVGLFEARGWTGKAKITTLASNEEVANRLWKLSEDLTGIQFVID